MGQSSEKGTQNVLYLKSRYSNVGLKAKMEDHHHGAVFQRVHRGMDISAEDHSNW